MNIQTESNRNVVHDEESKAVHKSLLNIFKQENELVCMFRCKAVSLFCDDISSTTEESLRWNTNCHERETFCTSLHIFG